MIYRSWLAPGREPIGPLIEDRGLAVPLKVGGVLHAWIRHSRGAWLALVSYEFETDSGLGLIRVRHLLPEKAVKSLRDSVAELRMCWSGTVLRRDCRGG